MGGRHSVIQHYVAPPPGGAHVHFQTSHHCSSPALLSASLEIRQIWLGLHNILLTLFLRTAAAWLCCLPSPPSPEPLYARVLQRTVSTGPLIPARKPDRLFLKVSNKDREGEQDMFEMWRGLSGLSTCWCLLMLIHFWAQAGKKQSFLPCPLFTRLSCFSISRFARLTYCRCTHDISIFHVFMKKWELQICFWRHSGFWAVYILQM